MSASIATGGAASAASSVSEFWRWDFVPEPDRMGIALVPIPPHARNFLEVKRRVELHTAEGAAWCGCVSEFNRIMWIARVKME